MKNLCGNCNVCCTVLRIDAEFLSWRDTDKEAGETCDKLINNRCARYKNRPKPCKRYKCLWIQLLELKKSEACPEKWRPDNLGLLVNTSNKENEFLFDIRELEKGKIDFNNSEILSFIDMIFKLKEHQGTSRVILYYFGKDKGYEIKQD
jgi:hypothetical protein